MEAFNSFLVNGVPVNGTGQPIRSLIVRPSTSAKPPDRGRQIFPSTTSLLLNQQSMPAINGVNSQTPGQFSSSSSFKNKATPVNVNINATIPKHMRLNNFNVIRRANTVVCGPNGPILDPRLNPNGLSENPYNRWPYVARSKPHIIGQNTILNHPVKPLVNPNTLKSQQKPSNIVILNGNLISKKISQPLPTNSVQQERQIYTNNASLQRQDSFVNKTSAKVVPKLNGTSEKSKQKKCILVMVADMETQTEEDYFSTSLNNSNLPSNGPAFVPIKKELKNSYQTEPLVKEELHEKSSNTEHIKSSDNPKLHEEPPVLAKIPRIKISNLQNKNQLVACLVDDNMVDAPSQTITRKNGAQENCDNITEGESSDSASISDDAETSSSDRSALLSESATVVESSIETVRTSSAMENEHQYFPTDSPAVVSEHDSSNILPSSTSDSSAIVVENDSSTTSTLSPANSPAGVIEHDSSNILPSSTSDSSAIASENDSSTASNHSSANSPACVIEQNDVMETNNSEVNSAQVEDTTANVPEDQPPKRKRGRPRKYPVDAPKPAELLIPKRGRGRPRKFPPVEVKEKKPRGRPRKYPPP